MNNYVTFIFGGCFYALLFIRSRNPRFIVWLAARVPHRHRYTSLMALRVVFNLFCYISFFWLVSLALFSLSEYFSWPL